MTSPFEDFYTPSSIERRVPLILTFYIKVHEKK